MTLRLYISCGQYYFLCFQFDFRNQWKEIQGQLSQHYSTLYQVKYYINCHHSFLIDFSILCFSFIVQYEFQAFIKFLTRVPTLPPAVQYSMQKCLCVRAHTCAHLVFLERGCKTLLGLQSGTDPKKVKNHRFKPQN